MGACLKSGAVLAFLVALCQIWYASILDDRGVGTYATCHMHPSSPRRNWQDDGATYPPYLINTTATIVIDYEENTTITVPVELLFPHPWEFYCPRDFPSFVDVFYFVAKESRQVPCSIFMDHRGGRGARFKATQWYIRDSSTQYFNSHIWTALGFCLVVMNFLAG